jgi:hypothetical protein
MQVAMDEGTYIRRMKKRRSRIVGKIHENFSI